MNIAEILKNCPEGTKLYSPIFGEVEFIEVFGLAGSIECKVNNSITHFHPDGTYHKGGECMLFPSKEQRDWSKFQIPFKFGDIVAMYNGPYQHTNIAIFDKYIGDKYVKAICTNLADSNDIKIFGEGEHWYKQGVRCATEKEKEFFFNLLKEQGYAWTGKELVNRFKIGDYITDGISVVKITEITDNYYFGHHIKFTNASWSLPLHKIKDWDLAKFDIRSLKPYDKVLVRTEEGAWYPSLVSYVSTGQVYLIDSESSTDYVIPFEGNEHLIGRWDDPDPYYITWE